MDDKRYAIHKLCCKVISMLIAVYDVIVIKYRNLKEDDNKRKFV